MTFELLTSITGSVVRHALTGIGVYLVSQGWISADDWSQLLAGIVLAVAGLIWSFIEKWKKPEPPPTA